MAPLIIKDKVDRRRRRRRVRHPRLRRRLRREDRQGSVALLHDSRSRRTGARHMERRRLEVRRRLGVGHRLVRSGAEPHLLGHRQSGARLESRSAARRQPLLRLGGRARRRHRQAEVAFPVHAERRLRLRLGAGAGARRHELAGEAGEGDDVGEPQRLLLRARSRDRQVPAGHSRSSR